MVRVFGYSSIKRFSLQAIYHRKLKTVAYLYQQNGSPFKGKNKGKKKSPKTKNNQTNSRTKLNHGHVYKKESFSFVPRMTGFS